jgi:hypothetical protein
VRYKRGKEGVRGRGEEEGSYERRMREDEKIPTTLAFKKCFVFVVNTSAGK